MSCPYDCLDPDCCDGEYCHEGASKYAPHIETQEDVDAEINAELDARRDQKWSIGEPGVVPLSTAWQDTNCSFCGKPLEAGDKIRDCFIFELGGFGDLKYIELAHVGCVKEGA